MARIQVNNTEGRESSSPGRPTRYNDNLKALHDTVDIIASQDYSEGFQKRLISSTDLAARMDFTSSAIRQNGFPAYWRDQYDSCEWQRGRGLIITLEPYLMERARLEYEEYQETQGEGGS